MGATFGKVQKIYELRTLGYDQVGKQLDNIVVKFNNIKKAKQDAAKAMADASKAQGTESEAFKKANAAYDEARLKQIQLKTEYTNTKNELQALQIVRQAEINQQKQQQSSTQAAAGSYNALRKEYNELRKATQNVTTGSPVQFQGQTISYDQAIQKLQQLSAAEQNFRRQFTQDKLLVGEYTSGIVQAFKQMGLDDLVGGQITKAKSRLKDLNSSFAQLKTEYDRVKVAGTGGLDAIEKKMIANRQEANQLNQQVHQLEAEFRGVGSVGSQITAGIANGFADMKNQLAQFVIGYFGFQAILSGAQKLIHQNYELSDSIAQIKIYTKGTTEEVNGLIDSLKKLDTRTSLAGLVDIATLVAKKGVAKDEIVGVTQALDQLFVVLGKEAGDPHEAVASMVKLVNVYSEDKHVTAKNIGDIGAAIAKLTSSGVATGRFLINFAERMAGIRGITGLSIDKVLGLGAALEELGQRSEVSGTALSQLIVKLFTDTQKYADITGKSLKEFKALLNDSPIDAFVLVAEKLKGNAGEMEKFFEGVTDIHARSGKMVGVLGDIAGNAEYARKRLAAATAAMGDQASLASAFAEKNQTFAATLDKIGKQFEILGSNRSVQVLLTSIAGIITFLLGNIPGLVIATGVWAAGWAILNKELFLAKANLLLVNAQILAGRIALAAITIFTNAYSVALALWTGTMRVATVTAQFLNSTLLATPLGIILTLAGLAAGTMAAFAGAISGTTEKVLAHAASLRLLNDIQNRVQDQIGATVNKTKLLSSVVADHTISETSRKKALQDLIAIAPEYLNKLTLENAATAEGKQILDGYLKSLREKAELQAGEGIANKAIEDRTKLEKTLFDLELKRKQGKTGKNDLTDEEQKFLSTGRRSVPFGAAIGSLFGKSTIDAAIQGVQDQINAKNEEVDQANAFVKAKYDKLGQTVKEGNEAVTNAPKPRTISTVKEEIKTLDEQINVAEIGSQKLKDLVSQRTKLQKELQDAEGKTNGKDNASKITGTQRDELRDKEAAREEELSFQKLKFAEGKLSEEDYLKNILQINRKYIDAKLALIKGSNSAERKLISDLKSEKVDNERETNEKLFKLGEERIKDTFDHARKEAESTLRAVENSPIATPSELAQAKLDADKAILTAQTAFNESMDQLEKSLHVQSKKNAEERADSITTVNQNIQKDQLSLSKATIEDIKKQGEAEIAAYKANVEKQKLAVAQSNKSTPVKQNLTDKLNKTEEIGVLALEVATMEKLLPKYKQQLKDKEKTKQEYNEFVTQLYEKQQALQKATLEGQKKNLLSFADGLKSIIQKLFVASDEMSATIMQGLSGAYSLAQDAMNGFFNNEQQRIKESQKNMQDRLDTELEQAKARAQSKAEEERLEKQYALKKKQADKQAGEELKKAKKKEARLALVTELANIAAAAAANVLNGVTFGAAGVAQFAVQSVLALGRYAIRINEIDNTQFAYGGSPDVPTRGGRFGGKPHSQGGTPFMYKGRRFEGEIDELAVIRTKNAPTGTYSITGNHTQIASGLNALGGGISFAPGAQIQKYEFGGGLGESLKAPVFTPSYSNSPVNTNSAESEKYYDLILEQTKAIQAVNGRIDKIEVVQVTRSVTDAQKKHVKQSNIGTL
ncbi:phage tail tape measure protein [Chitinophaga sancti]|uniref:Phage tail tape measure protein n=1 Tax=Chitinophaga sancti TaxID=1004 RepID=A0A1K1LYN6_9BACT|nr:phage tail tape measure protein [Chitinophaga sancti]WQD64747.1 phage tail tape measure protein [Chitinophaga sancti]WQG89631.1 phage tail tape measure protein [Chitinophaga sancti]SFW15952.1 Phage-related minor tail protein [Chitinophaga sancti]